MSDRRGLEQDIPKSRDKEGISALTMEKEPEIVCFCVEYALCFGIESVNIKLAFPKTKREEI
jgi:hypothetical protein